MEADCRGAIGGGSTTGLGKAIALRTDLPQIVIPTTYAGSEATPILGETVEGRKTTQRSPRILPEIVLYDIDLTLTLPVELSRSEEHTSELQSLMRISYAVFCLKKKTTKNQNITNDTNNNQNMET